MDAWVLEGKQKGGLGIAERLRAAGVAHISNLENMSNASACTASEERSRVNDELVSE